MFSVPKYSIRKCEWYKFEAVMEFDKTLTEEERRVLEGDGFVVDKILSIVAVRAAFPKKSIPECLEFCKDDRNWIGCASNLTDFFYRGENAGLYEIYKEFFGVYEIKSCLPPRREILDFCEIHFGFRWVNVGKVLFGVRASDSNPLKLKQHDVFINNRGVIACRVFAPDAEAALEIVKKYEAKGGFAGIVIDDSRVYDLETARVHGAPQ